jgi:hypothetical protein
MHEAEIGPNTTARRAKKQHRKQPNAKINNEVCMKQKFDLTKQLGEPKNSIVSNQMTKSTTKDA